MAEAACTRCGASNADGAMRCASCGAELAMYNETLPASGTPMPVSAPGDSLVGRSIAHYHVAARLGGGGMGVVYRAVDSRLQRPIALKVLSPSLAHDVVARARFEREARAASALDHPNIGTIYEIGEHDGRLYMAMALYEGETLRQRIQRGTPPYDEIERIMGQLAAALESAHGAGIVHRDIKPANVMLLRDGTVKLVDFGLAKRPGEDQALTGAGGVVGTVLYMSPEQVRGREVDARSDLWALGVVLYEMVTGGRLPFEGASGAATGVKIIEEDPHVPEDLRARMPPHLVSLMDGLLKKDPNERIARASDVRKLLAAAGPGPASGTIPAGEVQSAARPGRTAPRWVIPAAAGLALVVAAAGVGYRFVHRSSGTGQSGPLTAPSGLPGAAGPRRTIAVLGFKNLSGRPDAAWLSTALGEMLSTELAASDRVRSIPGETVARMKIELGLSDAESLASDTLRRVRANVGADLLVLGSYLSVGAKLRLDLRIQSATDGEPIAAFAETGSEAELFDLVSRAGGKLRERLGAEDLSAATQASLRTLRPANVDAVKLYADGLTRLRAFDALGAREKLERAVSADPTFALAHSALAEALTILGRDGSAEKEARRAFDLSAGLPADDRLLVEARYHEAAHAWEPAIGAYRALADRHPDDLEAGLRLTAVQHLAGKRNESLATLALLRKLPPPSGDDPRIDLADATAADYLGDHREVLVATGRAAKGAEGRGMPLVVAAANNLASFAYFNLGDYPRALASAEEARRLFQSVGDRSGVGQALINIGGVRRHGGDLLGGAQAYREALEIYRELDSGRLFAETSNGLAVHEIVLGNFASAHKLLDDSMKLSREIGAKDWIADGNISLGRLSWCQGHLAEARRYLAEAITILDEIGDKRLKAWALSYVGGVALAQADLEVAESCQEQALGLRQGGGYRKFAAESRVLLAEVAIEKGHPEDAEPATREAAQVFRELASHDEEAGAQVVAARALLLRGRRGEASAAIDRAVALAGKSQDVEVRFRIALAAAQLQAHEPTRRAESLKQLGDAVAEATRLGFVDLQFEARLALGQAERMAAAPAARAHLKALSKDAEAAGFRLVARRAAEAAK